ncbi:hypothetical protein HKX48_004819 [Thoreauomyces humboldtii]|nr:hypothetical protein HKX48_004819 [Thoreauomyces humboldtii]
MTTAAVPPPSNRRQPPLKYPWNTLQSLPDLSAAVLHYLEHRAMLTSGVPDSLAKETGPILEGLKKMCRSGFATVSSQPGLQDEKMWQRFYVTGVLPTSKATAFIQNLQSHSFLTLISSEDDTTIHLPAPSSLPTPPPSTSLSYVPPTTTTSIPLTLTRTGPPTATLWRSVTDIPLPDALETIMKDAEEGERRDLVMEDDGALFEHHCDVNFGRFKLKRNFLRCLQMDAVVVTVVWPWWGETDEPLELLLKAVDEFLGDDGAEPADVQAQAA